VDSQPVRRRVGLRFTLTQVRFFLFICLLVCFSLFDFDISCVIWLITTIFPILMVIHVTPRPLFRILPTRHIITLTNLVCRIGLIRINTCPSPNTMNKTGIIITTLHRVNEIQLVTPRSRGYGDVTATYICRLEIPSRIYAKHSGNIHSNRKVQVYGYH